MHHVGGKVPDGHGHADIPGKGQLDISLDIQLAFYSEIK